MANKSYLEQPDLHTKAEHRAALLTYPGNLQEALRQAQADPKKTLFGVGQGMPSTFLTKVFASTKPDFIWMDVEHGVYDRATLYDAIHAAQHHSEGKTMAIVRVPKHDEISLVTALDAGASGIIYPRMESADDVREMIKRVYYPPIGERSFSPWIFAPGISDTSLYEQDAFNIETSNRHIAIIPQVESVKGLENIEEIAAVPGVTALMFGPGDYMADAGIKGRVGGQMDPRVLAAMGKVSEVAKKYGKPLLGYAPRPEMIPMMIQQGFRIIFLLFDVWGTAGLLHDRMKAARASLEGADEPDGESGEKTQVVNGKSPSV